MATHRNSRAHRWRSSCPRSIGVPNAVNMVIMARLPMRPKVAMVAARAQRGPVSGSQCIRRSGDEGFVCGGDRNDDQERTGMAARRGFRPVRQGRG